ncbi:MAG TPA: hypothetical protein VNS32_21200, partial [Flavisolibacter sp.]|nr:hypothetical protein [Flavisolibacter sp.]
MKYLIKDTQKSLFLFLLFLLFTTNKLMAQTIKPPTIIPPSPTAQTFMRYGEIPVNFSTGVPNIDIPIYTLEGRKLKLPISISYHASGIKVNDIASEVGLGWALNCGGMISRTVNGVRDEAKKPVRTYYNSAQLLNAVNTNAHIWDQSSTSLKGIMDFEYFFQDYNNGQNQEDAMSDRYFYMLPNGQSGVFTYDYSHLDEDANSVVTLPYRPWKIEKNVSYENAVHIDNFKITADDGTVYTFQSYLDGAPATFSEWFLKEMISADATDTIRFFYKPQIANYSITSVSQVYQSAPKNVDIANSCPIADVNYSVNNSYSPLPGFNTPVIDSIVSSTAVIKFVYTTRSDFSFLWRLSEIKITPKTAPNTIVRKAQFAPKYFGSTNEALRLGLDNVVITSDGD